MQSLVLGNNHYGSRLCVRTANGEFFRAVGARKLNVACHGNIPFEIAR